MVFDSSSLKRTFNPASFNFLKISKEEELTRFNNHALIVNVSPICEGHTLLVPFIEDCLP